MTDSDKGTNDSRPENPEQEPATDGAPEQDASEGLTVEDILDTPQSSEAAGADEGQGSDEEAARLLDDLRRLQAEFVNFKNRTVREKEQLRDFVVGDVISSLLPVFDDIDAARGAGDLEDGPFAAIAAKLEETLVKQGLVRIGEVGEAFDPTVHEAVLQQPTDEVEPDHVSMVLRSGFKVGDRVVRAAQVAVAVQA